MSAYKRGKGKSRSQRDSAADFRRKASLKLECTKWISTMAAIAFLAIMLLSGCASTIHPHEVVATQPGFMTVQDSGVGTMAPGGSYVPAEWVVNYNQGVADYGNDAFFKHPLKPNEGITIEEDGRCFASDEAHHNYGMFQSWRRNHTHQKPKTLLQKAGIL